MSHHHHLPGAGLIAAISELHRQHMKLHPPTHREGSYLEIARMAREMGHS